MLVDGIGILIYTVVIIGMMDVVMVIHKVQEVVFGLIALISFINVR